LAIGADIYVEGVRMGGCSFDAFDSKLSETVSRSSLSRAPIVSKRTCEHDDVVDGFAYIDLWNQHWPVRVCKTCRLILKGRDPNIEERDVPAWEMTEEDVLAAQWSKRWPRDGRPRAKKLPKGFVWPEAA
jgi:hypothetical protein